MVSLNIFGNFMLYMEWGCSMGYMKKISILCEEDDMEGLTEFLYDKGNNSMSTAINMAAGFMIAHRQMRMNSEDEAYKVLNNIHDRLQKEMSVSNKIQWEEE